MAKELDYRDTDRERYESVHWIKEDINDFLKDKKVVSVETLKKVIRFWYIIE